jgi:hypothetical protein
MDDAAVFQGALVNLKNSPTHKSVIMQIEVPEEYGEAVVRAFGWPTRVKPLAVAVARLEAAAEQPKAQDKPDHRRFNDLSPAEQAGIICKEEEFREFLQTTVPYKAVAGFSEGWQPEDLVRDACGVTSRADIKEGTEAARQWRIILERYRRWLDERERAEANVNPYPQRG